MTRVVSLRVIGHLSHFRVISSGRRYPSVGDMSNHGGTRTNPFGRFRHVTAVPEAAHAEASAGVMKGPAAQCIWYLRSWIFSIIHDQCRRFHQMNHDWFTCAVYGSVLWR